MLWTLGGVLGFSLMLHAWAPSETRWLEAWVSVGIGFLGLAVVLQRTSTCWGWASRVTLLRALITLSLAGFLWWPEALAEHGFALGLLGLVALLADGLDGYLARTRQEQSQAGARFDMETDAALMMVLSIAVWLIDRAGVWVLLIGGLRYVFVSASWVLPWLAAPLPESLRRKVICVVQVSVLLAVMPQWFSQGQAQGLLLGALALLWYSFGVDTLYLYRHKKQTTSKECL